MSAKGSNQHHKNNMSSSLDDEGWPVTTEEPFDMVSEKGLTPGPALLACSGSDITLARGATAKPNLEKGQRTLSDYATGDSFLSAFIFETIFISNGRRTNDDCDRC